MVDCKNPAFSLYKVLKVMQDFSINSIDPYMEGLRESGRVPIVIGILNPVKSTLEAL